MRKLALSAAVVLTIAVPAWAANPVPYVPEGPPTPAGYPTAGYAPPGYSESGYPAGFQPPPGMLPPGTLAPDGGPMPGANPAGFAFDPCYPSQRSPRPLVHAESWVRGDWLYWSFRDAPIPPLIVSGNPNIAGAGLNGGNSTSLVGPKRDLGRFNGTRVTVGQWFDPDGELGGELSAFIFGREGTANFFQGNAGRSLSVPVQGTNGLVGVYDFSFPGRFTGTLGVRTATQLWGGEANLLHRWYGDGCISVDGIFGYRHLQLSERLDLLGRAQSVGAIATFQGGTLPAGAMVFTTDSFRARTEFHGAQLGARMEVRRDMFTVTAYSKGGIGVNLQTLRVEGNTMATGGGITRTAVGGLRALPTNFGRDTNTDFSMMSENGIELGLQVTKNLSLRAGYNLLWWSDVLRPGNVVSPVVSMTQVPIDPTFSANVMPTRPVTVFRSSDFLAHGLVVGLVVDW